MVDLTAFRSRMPSRSWRNRGSASTTPPACGRCARVDLTSGKNIQQGASAKLAVRLNETTTLTSLTAYRKSNYRFFIDADATELPVQTSDVPDLQHQVSQELTLVQRTPKLTWIGGAFFFDEHNEGQVEITLYPTGNPDPALREDRREGLGAVRPGHV